MGDFFHPPPIDQLQTSFQLCVRCTEVSEYLRLLSSASLICNFPIAIGLDVSVRSADL